MSEQRTADPHNDFKAGDRVIYWPLGRRKQIRARVLRATVKRVRIRLLNADGYQREDISVSRHAIRKNWDE